MVDISEANSIRINGPCLKIYFDASDMNVYDVTEDEWGAKLSLCNGLVNQILPTYSFLSFQRNCSLGESQQEYIY